MSASAVSSGRRKQTCPKRVTSIGEEGTEAPNQNGGRNGTETPSLDSHVCGHCCTQFFSLQEFLLHKDKCTHAWTPLLSQIGGVPTTTTTDIAAAADNFREQNKTKAAAAAGAGGAGTDEDPSSSSSAIDLSLFSSRRSQDAVDAGMDPEGKADADTPDVAKLQLVLSTLQRQQIHQLQLIQQLCTRLPNGAQTVLPNGSTCNFPSSSLISPPNSNEAVGNGLENLRPQGSTAGACCLCGEDLLCEAALMWHMMEMHSEESPFRCGLCREKFTSAADFYLHSTEHRLVARLDQMRPRSVSPSFRNPTSVEEGRQSVPVLPQDSFDQLIIVNAKTKRRSSSVSSDDDGVGEQSAALSDVSLSSTPKLSIAEGPLDLSYSVSGVSVSDFHSDVEGEFLPKYQDPLRVESKPPIALPSTYSSTIAQSLYDVTSGHVTGNAVTVKDMPLNDDDWESMMEVSQTDENEKIRQLVGDKPQPPTTDPNQCLICRRILSCKSALQMHYRTHTGERPFKCKICLRAFTTKGNLKTHMGVHRSKHPFRLQHQCPICQKRFLNAVLLQQHVRQHTSQLTASSLSSSSATKLRDFQPSLSGHATKTSQDLGLKSKLESPVATVRPPQNASLSSEERFPISSSSFLSHLANPATLKHVSHLSVPNSVVSSRLPQTLSVPSSPFPNVMLPSPQQLSLITGRPNTMCNICFKTFACNSALEIHYRVHSRSHTKERPFKCNICNRGFSTKGNMKQHLLTHKIRDASNASSPSKLSTDLGNNNNNNAEESTGDSRSLRESSVESDMSGGDKDSPDTEQSSLFEKSDEQQAQPQTTGGGVGPSPLESIQRMWAKTEPPPPRKPPVLSKHQCGVCFKHFSSSSALQIHMRTHTGDKPFKCNMCGRAFTTKGNLKVHMGTHMWHNPSRRGRRIFDYPGGGGGGGGGYPESMNGHASDNDSKKPSPLSAAEMKSSANFSPIAVMRSTENNNNNNCNSAVPTIAGMLQNAVSAAGPFSPLVAAGFPGFVNRPSPLSAAASLPTSFMSSLQAHDISAFPQHSPSAAAFPPGFGSLFAPTSASAFPHLGIAGPQTPMETMMWMWRNVCSVCQKICSSPAELEEHLKLHLSASSLNENATAVM